MNAAVCGNARTSSNKKFALAAIAFAYDQNGASGVAFAEPVRTDAGVDGTIATCSKASFPRQSSPVLPDAPLATTLPV